VEVCSTRVEPSIGLQSQTTKTPTAGPGDSSLQDRSCCRDGALYCSQPSNVEISRFRRGVVEVFAPPGCLFGKIISCGVVYIQNSANG
jgi:hypothetical protein